MVQLPIKGQLHFNADTDNFEMFDGLNWRIIVDDRWEANKAPWQKWRAWKPVKDIHGRWHWGKTVYRRRTNTYVNHDDWVRYEYGTIFDVLKDTR